MAKSNSIVENTRVNTMELFILDTLLKGKNVTIPDFGHLELKTLGDRRTVLFKSSEIDDSFLKIVPTTGEKEKKDVNLLYTVISIPLKEGKTVNLPQIGVFTPKRKENGDMYVSFMLSSSLRNLLNNNENEVNKKTNEIKEAPNNQENRDETKRREIGIAKINELEKRSEGKSEIKESLLPNNNKGISSNIKRDSSLPSQTTTNIETHDEIKKPKSRNISGILLVVAAVLFVVVIVVGYIHTIHTKKNEERELILSNTNKSEFIDLPVLAEQHYGNPVFWIYIYEANLDKLKSPVNVPKNVSLVIPDLMTEFSVDVKDSMEIQKARIRADIILTQGKNDKNK